MVVITLNVKYIEKFSLFGRFPFSEIRFQNVSQRRFRFSSHVLQFTERTSRIRPARYV